MVYSQSFTYSNNNNPIAPGPTLTITIINPRRRSLAHIWSFLTGEGRGFLGLWVLPSVWSLTWSTPKLGLPTTTVFFHLTKDNLHYFNILSHLQRWTSSPSKPLITIKSHRTIPLNKNLFDPENNKNHSYKASRLLCHSLSRIMRLLWSPSAGKGLLIWGLGKGGGGNYCPVLPGVRQGGGVESDFHSGRGLMTTPPPPLRPVLRLLNNKLARSHGPSQHDHTGLYRVSSGRSGRHGLK